ncbi:MAG: helix-turn-helix domain-containing protein, partial [Gammaproteobacteria bacterium]
MRDAGEVDTGLTGNTVRRWEVGERWPEPRFRKHLVLIFGRPASELGLLTPDELEMCPLNELIVDLVRRLGSMLDPEMGRVGRQTFLRGLFGAGIAPALSPIGASVDNIEALANTLNRSAGPDPRAVDAYADIVSKQRALYWSTPARTMFEAALSHTQLGVQLLRGTTGDSHSERLATAVTESAMLSGRLAFVDIRQPAVAQRTFD